MHDEKSLVERARKNDVEAFAQLYEQNFDKIYRYIFLRVRSELEAEDLTQQVFLKALNGISSYKWSGIPFSAWLFRIAHNQIIDYRRKSDKMQTTSLEWEVASVSNDPLSIVECEMDIEQVLQMVGNLTELQQEVISLRFSSELSTTEVARIMGRSEGAIKALQHSALNSLRKMLIVEKENGQEV